MENRSPDPADIELSLADWLQAMNQRLNSAGASSAELAFSRGCTSSLAPAGVVIVVAFLLGARHWVSIVLTSMAVGMLALAWAAFAASQAQHKSVERFYVAEILPEIKQGLAQRNLTMTQVIQEARQNLPGQSPLRTCLDNSSLHASGSNGVEHGE